MKKNIGIYLKVTAVIAAFFLTFVTSAVATPITTLPYVCGFENATENARWSLNDPNPYNLVNKWSVGNGASQTGSKSLYISNDGGYSNSYYGVCVNPPYTNPQDWNRSTLTYAWREFDLPAGTYDLSFAWRSEGGGNNGGDDVLGVCWVPSTTYINSVANPWSIPSWINPNLMVFDGNDVLKKSREMWIDERTQIVSTGQPMKLVFLWKNDDYLSANPPAAIDNILISACASPTNFQVVDDGGGSVTLTWNETDAGSQYEIDYGLTTGGKTTLTGVVGNSQTIYGLNRGAYEFRIRTSCGGGKASLWTEAYTVVSYVPDENCVDFLDLYSSNTVCKTAEFYYASQSHTSFQTGVVDYGFDSRMSRHTIHYPGETDPLTNGKLPTVPPGEEASVRLGNRSGGEIETIEYTMNVPTGSAMILSMKYAILLEAPGHGYGEDPGFKLDITDMYGNPIDKCSQEEFFGDASMVGSNGWHKEIVPGFEDIIWKDWTTIGVNLQPYAGQTIKIRLETKDCIYKTHFGYAYFTLSCSEAKISGLPCGLYAIDTISAPDGFDYEWYNVSNPGVVVSYDQNFKVPQNDTSTYMCKVKFIGDPSCYFTLTAEQKERYPLADFEYVLDSNSCDNMITFQNKSGITVDGALSDEDCETYEWDFGNGQTSTEKNPVMRFPAAGTYTVTLVAGLSKKACTDTMTMKITVDKPSRKVKNVGRACVGSDYLWRGKTLNHSAPGVFTHTDTALNPLECDTIYTLELTVIDSYTTNLSRKHCEGYPFVWGGQSYTLSSGVHVFRDTLTSVEGCDSVLVMSVDVMSVILIPESDTVCVGGNYTWHGKTIKTSVAGLYSHYDSLKTVSGCDSIHRLDLLVNVPDVKEYTASMCEGDTYTWRGKVIKGLGVGPHVIYDSLVTAAGCDDVHRLTLTVNETYHFAEARTICDGERLVWRGVNQVYPVGEHTLYDSLVSKSGCDSVYELKLTVAPKYMFAETHSVCQNDSYTWRGQMINTNVAGTTMHYERHTSALGCDSVYQLTLTVNPVYAQNVERTVCAGESFVWNGNTYSYEPGTHTLRDTLTTVNGCDSSFVVTINVSGMDTTLSSDTICSNEAYDWNGQMVDRTGVYTHKEQNSYGCDVHYYELNVQVRDALEMTFDVTDFEVCADDEHYDFGYTIDGGGFTAYSIEYIESALNANFKDESFASLTSGDPLRIVIPVPADTSVKYVLPGDYGATITFHNDECGDVVQPIRFKVQYPTSVIAQRWNDVLAVKNSRYNGGFEFTEYQWYKNDEEIDGQTTSILYVEGVNLDSKAEYRVKLKRRSDGVEEMTCAIVPTVYDDGELDFNVNFISSKGTITSSMAGDAKLYTVSGILLDTFCVEEGETVVDAPEVSGVYVLSVTLENGQIENRKIIVR